MPPFCALSALFLLFARAFSIKVLLTYGAEATLGADGKDDGDDEDAIEAEVPCVSAPIAATRETTTQSAPFYMQTINWERSPKEESAAPRRVVRRLAGSDWPLEVSDASRNHNALSFARCDDWRLRTGRLIIKMVSGVVQCAGRTGGEAGRTALAAKPARQDVARRSRAYKRSTK